MGSDGASTAFARKGLGVVEAPVSFQRPFFGVVIYRGLTNYQDEFFGGSLFGSMV